MHTMGFPEQLPALHVSDDVHALLSSHAVAFATCWHPDAAWQVSSVHALPSSQRPAMTTYKQPFCGSQLSVVQGLPSSHASDEPLVQTVPMQVSASVHALLSSQGTCPVAGAC